MRFRKVSMVVGVLALGLYLAGSGLQAQENKTTQQRPGSTTGGTSATAHGWSGRIANVDSTKHEINLENVHRWNPSNTGTKTSGSNPAATGQPPARTGSGSAASGTNAKHSMTFKVATGAKITLDGKTATLSQLKSGQYARVSSDSAEHKTGSTTSGSASGATKNPSSGTGSGAAGKTVHTVNRIEAFTKEPASTGTRPGTIK